VINITAEGFLTKTRLDYELIAEKFMTQSLSQKIFL